MKLKKLNIHNLASIENATIDFESEPLHSSEVFLITGKTGSGKSTLLDAISLALYAKTPRLVNTKMNGRVEDLLTAEDKDKKQEIGIDDERNLLRRETGEGWAKLWFEGTNEVNYEATWSVARARKNPTGTLQPKRWELKNLESGVVLNKDKEIEAEIAKAVGLDFPQFCRTAMLAQGEFTKFLNSSDKEKSEILEKITGVDIYSKIGVKIFEKAREVEEQYKQHQGVMEQVKVMTEDEREAQLTEQKRIEHEESELVKLQQSDDKGKKWLLDELDLRKREQQSELDYTESMKVIESDEFKLEEATVKEWHQTKDARMWLSEYRRHKSSIEAQQKELSGLEGVYKICAGGELWRGEQLTKLQQKLMQIEQFLKEEDVRKSVYEKEQTIVAQLDQLIKSRKDLTENAQALKQAQDSLIPLNEAYKQAEISLNEAAKQYETVVNRLKVEEQALNEMGLVALRESKDGVVKCSGDLKQAKLSVQYLNAAQKKLTDAKAQMERLQKELGEKHQAVALEKKSLDEATKAYEKSKLQLDAMKLSVNELAATMRSGLKEGERCPVCGQPVVAHLIPVEESLQNAYQLAQQLSREAEAKMKTLESKVNGLHSEIVGLNKGVEQGELAMKSGEGEVEKLEQQALAQMKVCGLEALEREEQLQERIVAIEVQLAQLNDKLLLGAAKEKEVENVRKEVNRLLELRDKCVEKKTATQTQVKDCEAKIQVMQSQQTTLKQSEEESMRLVGEWIVVEGWERDWKTEPVQFKEELKRKGAAYRSAVELRTKLVGEVDLMKREVELSVAVQNEILMQCEVWKSLEVTAATSEVLDLNQRWNGLQNRVVATLQKKQTAEAEQKDFADKLNQFMKEHPSLQRNRLEFLGSINEATIETTENQLRMLRENVAKCLGEKENCKKQYEKHLENRPVLGEGETADVIESRMKVREIEIAKLQQQKGVIQQIFKEDENRKNQQSDLRKKIEELQAKSVKWGVLKEMFGDAQGSKFRTIAQSYILASLLNSANYYMKTLSGRYQLKGQPGTFVIMLEDAYQGYARRAASTLSGGESFLVSLSLALALSDIGQRLSVDTLFIDEGFGTLSGTPLRNAIETLRQLHTTGGRRVGIISHVEELKERIPVQIQVNQMGNNSYSEVNVVG